MQIEAGQNFPVDFLASLFLFPSVLLQMEETVKFMKNYEKQRKKKKQD